MANLPLINKKNARLFYAAIDFAAALLSWTSLYVFRKTFIEGLEFDTEFNYLYDQNFYLGIILIPFFWTGIYFFSGSYTYVYQKSRLGEVVKTFIQTLSGVVFLFFLFLLDDIIYGNYKNYYYSF